MKRDDMSAEELKEFEEVRALITRGEQVGVLTFAEIVIATARPIPGLELRNVSR